MLATAPLAKHSNRQFIKAMRLLSEHATIWTEMVCAASIVNRPDTLDGLAERHLPSRDVAGRRVLQLASSDPAQLQQACEMLSSSAHGDLYDEVNLNCGCPAESAGHGMHGAVLLKLQERDRLRRLCDALVRGTGKQKDASIKIRTGVVGESSFEALIELIEDVVLQCGVAHVILHARDAILTSSISPRDNLKIPPLRRDWAERLRSHLGTRVRLTYNGEVKSMEEARALVEAGFTGAMMGRKMLDGPYELAAADHIVFRRNDSKPRTREEVALDYATWLETNGSPSAAVNVAPLINLFFNTPHAKQWKKALMELRHLDGPGRLRAGVESVSHKLATEAQ